MINQGKEYSIQQSSIFIWIKKELDNQSYILWTMNVFREIDNSLSWEPVLFFIGMNIISYL